MSLSLPALLLELFITMSSNLEKQVCKTFMPSNHTSLSENNERTNDFHLVSPQNNIVCLCFFTDVSSFF